MKNIIEEARKIHSETVQEVRGLVFDGVRPLIVEMLEQTPDDEQQNSNLQQQQPDPTMNPLNTMDNVVPPNAATTPPTDPAAPAEPSPLDSLGQQQMTPPAEPIPAIPQNDVQPAAVPIQASPVAGMPMPGPDGKITVNFEDLWATKAPPEQPVPQNDLPPPSAPSEPPVNEPAPDLSTQNPQTAEQPTQENPSDLPPELQLENKINVLFETFAELKEIKLNELQKKFFELALLEMLDELDSLPSNSVKERVNKLTLESKLNKIYNSALSESKKDNNTYYQSKGSERMNKATLREFKAKLALNEEAAAPYLNKDEKNAGDAFGKPLKQDSNASTQDAKAKSASDGRPVKDPGKKALPAEKKADEEKPWFKGTPEKPLSENALEQLEEELMKMLGVNECGDSSDKEVVMGEESSLEECAGEPVSVNVKISAGPGVSLDVGDAEGASDGLSLGDDDELEIVDDDDEVSDVMSKDDADLDLDDEPSEEDDDGGLDLSDESPVEGDNEDEDMKKPEIVSELRKQLAEAKKELNETQVLTACSIYTNKIFANYHSLSETQKRKIVKYFDGVGTIAEAKAVYTTIKKVLLEKTGNNSKSVTKGLAESASRPVKPATKQTVITESVSPLSKVTFNVDRWQTLAGIKK